MVNTTESDAKVQADLDAAFESWTAISEAARAPDPQRLAEAMANSKSAAPKIEEYLLGRTKPDASLRYR